MKLLLLFILISCFIACDTDNSNSNVRTDLTGTLYWGGSPAVDGLGILFRTDGTEYGAPGSKQDYSEYFTTDANEISIIADIRLTGEETVRGWGATFPEIEFLSIKVIE